MSQASTASAVMPHALIVDDEPSVRLLLDRVLQRAGYKVTVAIDGNQAVELLRRGVYDVVLTDKNMPGLDGVDVARFARQALPDATIVLITGYANPQSAEDSDGVVDAYLTKPFKVHDLELEIAALRDRRRSINVRRNASPKAGATAPVDVALLLSRGGDRDRLEEALQRAGHRATRLAGAQAVAELQPGMILFVDDESCTADVYRAVWLRQARDPSFRVVLVSSPEHPHGAINAVSLGAVARLARHAEDEGIAEAIEIALRSPRSVAR